MSYRQSSAGIGVDLTAGHQGQTAEWPTQNGNHNSKNSVKFDDTRGFNDWVIKSTVYSTVGHGLDGAYLGRVVTPWVSAGGVRLSTIT